MRWLLIVALVAGCSSGKKQQPKPGEQAEPTASKLVPVVSTASVLAVDDGVPPLVVIIDEAGKLHLAAIDSWADLASKDPMAGAKPGSLHDIYMVVMEAFFLDTPPRESLAQLEERGAAPVLEPRSPSGLRDDPPPPEDEMQELEEDVPESGREEGQYKMKITQDVEGRRLTGDRGRLAKRANGRAARIAGEVVADGKLRQQYAAIMAAPRARAAMLIDVLVKLEGSIVVRHGRTIRPLRVNFRHDEGVPRVGEPKRIETRLSKAGVKLDGVVVELPRMAEAIEKARTAQKLDPRAPVDVLVEGDVDAQRLVDLIVALETTGVTMIGLGP